MYMLYACYIFLAILSPSSPYPKVGIGGGGLVVGDCLKLVEAKQVKCITWDNIVVDSNENVVVRLLKLKDASMPDIILRP